MSDNALDTSVSSAGEILFVVDEFLPITAAPAVRIHNFIVASGEKQVVVVGGKKKEESSESSSEEILLLRPSEHKPLTFLFFLVALQWRAWRVLKSRRIDLLVVSVPKYELLFSFPFLTRFANRAVLDIRDSIAFLDYEAYLHHFLPRMLAKWGGRFFKQLSEFFFRRSLRAAWRITTANEGIARSVASYGFSAEVISNGVDVEVFKAPATTAPYSLPLQLIYVGNFAEKDDFDFITRGLAKFQQKTLVNLVGDGRNKYRTLQALEQAKISYVDHGIIGHNELPQVLAGMHLGFIFRKSGVEESIPVAIFEFAAMNIPTICNSVGMMAELVRKRQLGFIVKDAEELSSLVAKLIAEPDELRRFSGLHQLAAEEFSLARQAKRFRELIVGD